MPVQSRKHAHYAFGSFRHSIFITVSLLVFTMTEVPTGIDAFYLEPSRYRIQEFPETKTALKGFSNNDDGAKKPLRKWGKPKNGSTAGSENPTRIWGQTKSIQLPAPEPAAAPREMDDGATNAAGPTSYSSRVILPDEEEEKSLRGPEMSSAIENNSAPASTPVLSPTISMPSTPKIPMPAAATAPVLNSTPEYQRIQTLVHSHPLLMFMNGSQANPKDEPSDTAAKVLERLCGAGSMSAVGSKQMRNENLFVMMDVTSDDTLRQGLEEYHPNWDPSIPQVYINGDCRGGAEQMLKLFNTGEFQKLINQIELKQKQ